MFQNRIFNIIFFDLKIGFKIYEKIKHNKLTKIIINIAFLIVFI